MYVEKKLFHGKKLLVAYTTERSEQVDLGFKISKIQHRNITMPDNYDKVAFLHLSTVKFSMKI